MDNQLLARLRSLGQEHLVAFWDTLDSRAQQSLAEQIEGIDFDLIAQLGQGGQTQEVWAELAARALPPTAIRLADRTPE
jgi:UDP-N-acetylglucosamine/UDP-N-acetylgalactosamine diphosphorylase